MLIFLILFVLIIIFARSWVKPFLFITALIVLVSYFGVLGAIVALVLIWIAW